MSPSLDRGLVLNSTPPPPPVFYSSPETGTLGIPGTNPPPQPQLAPGRAAISVALGTRVSLMGHMLPESGLQGGEITIVSKKTLVRAAILANRAQWRLTCKSTELEVPP